MLNFPNLSSKYNNTDQRTDSRHSSLHNNKNCLFQSKLFHRQKVTFTSTSMIYGTLTTPYENTSQSSETGRLWITWKKVSTSCNMMFLYAHALKLFYSEKLSESLTGIEPVTFRSPMRCSDHWVTRTQMVSKSYIMYWFVLMVDIYTASLQVSICLFILSQFNYTID